MPSHKDAPAADSGGRVEVLDHSGDIGLRIWAPRAEHVFRLAAEGMFDILTDRKRVSPQEKRTVSCSGGDLAELLVRWLNELNFLFSTEGLLLCRFDPVRLSGTTLRAETAGEFFDPNRHEIYREIKAATYHQLKFERQGDGWFAQIIFDL